MFAVYEIVNRVTGKRYIGSSVNVTRREKHHWYCLRLGQHRNRKLQNSWKSHGEQAFQFKVLGKVDSHSEMLELEQLLIDDLQAVSQGYNLNPVAAHIGGLPKSEEHRRNIGLARLGKRNTPESIKRMSEAAKRRGPIYRSPEAYEKGAAKRRGQKRSPEFCAKMREIALARGPRPPWSAEDREKIRQRRLGTKLINGKFLKVNQDA